VSLAFVVTHGALGTKARWILCRKDVGPEVVDLLLLTESVDVMRLILVQDSRGTSLDQCATMICVSLLTTCLFIGSQSFVGDDVFP
jgi:hypothetical protein